MYNYRKMSTKQRAEAVAYRRRRGQPLHSPPHWDLDISDVYFISAGCYEHQPIIGKHPARFSSCEEGVLSACGNSSSEIYAWSVLPNHYHLLARAPELKQLTKALGHFHGRSSRAWNQEDFANSRKCWHRCFDRAIRSERHFWATINYIHHNPVYHGYVDKWQDWPWSSADDFLELTGKEEAARIWRDYPILDYGKTWDI
jgi:putative transposase